MQLNEAVCAADWLGVDEWPTLGEGRSEVREDVRAMLVGGMKGRGLPPGVPVYALGH